MSSYIPLAQFARQLASAGSGSDISGWTATIGQGQTSRSFAASFADAPFIEWFGLCGFGGDDTAVFTKAVQSGLPFRLGPKTYIVNGSWSTGGLPFLIFCGYAGLSRLLRMEGGATGAWIGLECPIVAIDGVIFDANGNQVSANTWGVLVDSPVTSAKFTNCAFRNNTGGLGRGLAIIGTGTASATTTYLVRDCEFSGNSSDGCGIFQASDVTVAHCRAFQNGASGIGVSVTGSISASNSNQSIAIIGNSCWGNTLNGINLGTFNPGGQTPPVYTLAEPSIIGGTIAENVIVSNGSYGIQAYGDFLEIAGNHVTQQSTAAGGILMAGRHSSISRNRLDVSGVYIGIDTGGCYDCTIADNRVLGARVGINPGGSQAVDVTGNTLIECRIGISVYDVETDGSGIAFPAPVAGLSISRNTVIVADGAIGVAVFDGGSAISITENSFLPGDAAASAGSAIALWTGGARVCGNMWNGESRAELDSSISNILVVPDVFDSVKFLGAGGLVDSVLPQTVSNSAGQVSYLAITSPGSGYTQSTVTINGAGSGATATALVYGGQVIGFRVITRGAGYLATGTTCTISGDGSGASAQVFVGTPIQANRSLAVAAPQGMSLSYSGHAMTQANATSRDLVIAANSVVELVEANGIWLVTGFYPASVLQSTSHGDVTLASPAGATLSLMAGAGGAIIAPNLPSGAAGLPSGALWRNGNAVSIV